MFIIEKLIIDKETKKEEFYICNGQRDIVYTVMMTAPDNTSEVD